MIVNKLILLAWVGVFTAGFLIACRPPEPPAGEPASESPAPLDAPVELSPSVRLADIKMNLEAVKADLNAQGDYNCCVQPTCHWCALHEGSCECFSNLQAGEAVCAGCGLGWHNEQGAVDGVDSSSVEWAITHEHPTGGHEH